MEMKKDEVKEDEKMASKKPGLAILIASKMKGKTEDKEEDGGDLSELSQMLIDDLKSEDAEKFSKDLKSFIKMCCMEE